MGDIDSVRRGIDQLTAELDAVEKDLDEICKKQNTEKTREDYYAREKRVLELHEMIAQDEALESSLRKNNPLTSSQQRHLGLYRKLFP